MPDHHPAEEAADEAVDTDHKAPQGSDSEPAVNHRPASAAGPATRVAAPTDRTPAASRSARPRARRALQRTLITLPVALGVLVAGSYTATALLDIPSPTTLVQLLNTEPSRQGDLFATRTIPASATPVPLPIHDEPLPATVPWKGERVPTGQFLATTHTNAFLVLRDGRLTHEWYRDGVGPTTRLSSWSAAKSVVSLLAGQAIEQGKLREDDRLIDILPQLKTGGAYDTITVRDLLDMTSGVDVPENYNEYYPMTGTARMYLTRDLPAFAQDHRDLQFPPGSQGAYRSIDTELLGQVLAKVQGRPLADLLADNIWAPMGAQDSATWNLDHDNGHEKAFCCINATPRDYAKLGQLVLNNGRAQGKQIIPLAWIKRIATPAPHKVDGWGYSAQWWHPPGGNGKDYSALGVYGQYIYVDPASRTVVVKLSDYGDQQDEQETFDALRAIAQSS
ncbi:serine hydrolase [Streptomyces phaeochromogenes]|uniref:Serine hydrolase n=1 Tax=Streptomyces phaeochromogenes TaxID=1923 RepID=A0ABZ1H3H4_STRPH|nr:serine hydrolase [Streptomyces phaeochromogenes]WSD12086.1 serine hydrolase [Streptomyces phaeochromogenes]